MVGSTLHRHDNVHRQLAAFTELLRRVQAHYANDQLHQMLHALCLHMLAGPHRTNPQQHCISDVTSLSQLRSLVTKMRTVGPRRGTVQRLERKAVVSYFERFFDDVDRLLLRA